MGLMRWLVTGSAHKVNQKITKPSDRVEAKAEWHGRYAKNHRFLESEKAYQERTGDTKPSWLW